MLIQEQSYERLLDKLQSTTPSGGSDAIVVAISPNSCASIASMLHISSTECFLRIATILKSLGVRYVIDASVGGDVALVEAREEFLHRYRVTDLILAQFSSIFSSFINDTVFCVMLIFYFSFSFSFSPFCLDILRDVVQIG